MFLAKIYITLKPTVNDPQGQTILGGLKSLGFGSVDSVRMGKYLEVRVSDRERGQAEEQVNGMCRKLLSNPVIEDFRFELEDLTLTSTATET
jgi:phosphoribosylformylglycinamidine synthase